jgi:dGTP triphosphohydrolase
MAVGYGYAADDIVYSVADIEDGVKKGVLRWSDVEDDLVSQDDESARKAIAGMHRILKAGRSQLPEGLADDVKASASDTENKLPIVYHRYQFLTDYVCGMTDTFAKRLHSELKNG